MKLIAAFGALLVVSSLQAHDNETIKDKSPDGKFALRMIRKEEGWSASIIDLKGKDEVVGLEIYENQDDSSVKQGHLVWSTDSQGVAYFEPDRRGGSTTVYFRTGSGFERFELLDVPECKNPTKEGENRVKTIESTIEPQKWLSPSTLVLRVHSEDLMDKGDGGDQWSQTCTQMVTVVFDSNHKASVQSVKRVP